MKKVLILSVLGLAILAPSAVAAPLCTTGDLGSSSYGNAGFSCSIGDNIFSGFTFNGSGTGNPLTNNGAQVTVTPVINALGIGFSFSVNDGGLNTFHIAGTGSTARNVNDTIQYSVNAPLSSFGPWFISARSTVVGGAVGLAGTYSMTKTLYSDAARTIPIDVVDTITNTSSPQTAVDPITGAPVITFYVKDQINLNTHGAAVGNTVSITSLENTFLAPEPGSMTMFGAGLIGLSFILRRRKA